MEGYNDRGIIMSEKIHLEYAESLNREYTKNYIEIIFDKTHNNFDTIYLYNSKHGTITFEKGKKEIHRWENEDEAQSGSYLDKHYPILCLNGITADPVTERKIIEENHKYITTLHLDEEKTRILEEAFRMIQE